MIFPKFLIELNVFLTHINTVGSDAEECVPCEACEPCLPCIALPGAETDTSTPAPGPPPDGEGEGDTDASHRLSATLAISFVGLAMLV